MNYGSGACANGEGIVFDRAANGIDIYIGGKIMIRQILCMH